MTICAVIPAAGRGSRLGLEIPKILVPIDEQHVIWNILCDLLTPVVDHIHVVVAPKAVPMFHEILDGEASSTGPNCRGDAMRRPAHCQVTVSSQTQPLGMGDAIFGAHEYWSKFDSIIVIWGDQVNLSPDTIQKVAGHCRPEQTIVLPLARCQSPYVQYDLHGSRLTSVRSAREGDAMDDVGAADVGIFGLSVSGLKESWDDYLAQASSGSLTGEINFVPFLPFLSSKHNWQVSPIEIKDPAEARGVNTVEDLEFARARYARLGKR